MITMYIKSRPGEIKPHKINEKRKKLNTVPNLNGDF